MKRTALALFTTLIVLCFSLPVSAGREERGRQGHGGHGGNHGYRQQQNNQNYRDRSFDRGQRRDYQYRENRDRYRRYPGQGQQYRNSGNCHQEQHRRYEKRYSARNFYSYREYNYNLYSGRPYYRPFYSPYYSND